RRRHTRSYGDWSSDVCSSDLSLRILTVLARFGTEQYPQAEEEIKEIFKRQMPKVNQTVVTVDNALPRDVVEEHRGGFLLGGDNRSEERRVGKEWRTRWASEES